MASVNGQIDYAANLFAPTFQHVNAFRLLMMRYGALVAGSSVLRLFVEDQAMRCKGQAQAWAPSDLDIYVSRFTLGEVGLVDWHVFFTLIEDMTLDVPDVPDLKQEEQYSEVVC